MDREERVHDEAADDENLVHLALNGEANAFDALVRKHQKRAVALAYRLLGNADDAADIAQDALLRAYRNLGQLADPKRFRPWMLRIVTNLSLNYRRSRKSAMTGEFDESRDAPDALRSPTGASLDRAPSSSATNGGDVGSAVRSAIAALPEKQRLSLVLSAIENVPQKEIAEILSCSVELVKWNVFQARKTLKESLADLLTPDEPANEN